MKSREGASTGSWLRFNTYAEIAFDGAQIGQFKQAQAALVTAAQQGESQVVIGWVRGDIRLLHQHG